MGLIDTLVVLTIALSALIAFSRGLVRELLGLAAWILSIVGAIYGVEYVQPLFLKYIHNQMLANIAGIATISLVILIVCTIINAKIAKNLRKSALSGLDRVLGLFFGILRGLFLIIVVYLCSTLLVSKEEMLRYKEANWTMPLIEGISSPIEMSIPKDLFSAKGKDRLPEPKELSKEAQDAPDYDEEERQEMDALILEQIQ